MSFIVTYLGECRLLSVAKRGKNRIVISGHRMPSLQASEDVRGQIRGEKIQLPIRMGGHLIGIADDLGWRAAAGQPTASSLLKFAPIEQKRADLSDTNLCLSPRVGTRLGRQHSQKENQQENCLALMEAKVDGVPAAAGQYTLQVLSRSGKIETKPVKWKESWMSKEIYFLPVNDLFTSSLFATSER